MVDVNIRAEDSPFTNSYVLFFESPDYVTDDDHGRRFVQPNPSAFSVSYNVRERTILAYQGGGDVTDEVSILLHLPYRYGVIEGGYDSITAVVEYLRECYVD